METTKNKQSSGTICCNKTGLKNGAGANSQNAIAYLVHSFLLLVALCIPPPAISYTVDLFGNGSHLIHTTYHQTYDEAVSACNVFLVSHGYEPRCGPSGVPNLVGAGWVEDHFPDTILPFHLGWFYHNPVCPPPLVFTEDQGCINKDDSCPVGNPINIGIGNKTQTETDFIGSGAFPLSVVRTLRSMGNPGNSHNQQWQFFSQLVIAPGISTVVVRPDGRRFLFTPDGAGGWLSDPDITGTLEGIEDGGVQTGWRYTTLDKQVEIFNIHGQLLSVTNRAGLTHTYVYNATDTTVTHSNGHVLVYHRPYSDHVIYGFTSPDNELYSYSYSYSGYLIGVTYPDSSTRTYHYQSNLRGLTGITDANGDRFATWTYDANGRAISSEHNGGTEKVTIDYTHIDDAANPRATATNALGKQATYHFADIFGARKIVKVEGHPSTNCAAANKDYAYDANGHLASKTDWKGNTTTYVRNAKGQELSRTEAFGTPQARTITTEWHPTFNLRTKVTEPDRETTYTYDANGNLLSQQTTDLLIP